MQMYNWHLANLSAQAELVLTCHCCCHLACVDSLGLTGVQCAPLQPSALLVTGALHPNSLATSTLLCHHKLGIGYKIHPQYPSHTFHYHTCWAPTHADGTRLSQSQHGLGGLGFCGRCLTTQGGAKSVVTESILVHSHWTVSHGCTPCLRPLMAFASEADAANRIVQY